MTMRSSGTIRRLDETIAAAPIQSPVGSEPLGFQKPLCSTASYRSSPSKTSRERRVPRIERRRLPLIEVEHEPSRLVPRKLINERLPVSLCGLRPLHVVAKTEPPWVSWRPRGPPEPVFTPPVLSQTSRGTSLSRLRTTPRGRSPALWQSTQPVRFRWFDFSSRSLPAIARRAGVTTHLSKHP